MIHGFTNKKKFIIKNELCLSDNDVQVTVHPDIFL